MAMAMTEDGRDASDKRTPCELPDHEGSHEDLAVVEVAGEETVVCGGCRAGLQNAELVERGRTRAALNEDRGRAERPNNREPTVRHDTEESK